MGLFRKKNPVTEPLPYVSGILATTRVDRHPFAQLAIDSFLRQDWPHVQVVVFNATGKPFKKDKRVLEIGLRAMGRGEMLNLALHNADGKYCALLFDDIWYDRTYLRVMMRDIGRETLHLLRYKQVFSISSQRVHLVDDDRVFCPVWLRNFPAKFTVDFDDFTHEFYNLKRISAPSETVVRFVS